MLTDDETQPSARASSQETGSVRWVTGSRPVTGHPLDSGRLALRVHRLQLRRE